MNRHFSLCLTAGALLIAGCSQSPPASTPSQPPATTSKTVVIAPAPLEAATNYKYPPGTMLAAPAAKGQYSLLKVLRVEQVKSSAPGKSLFVHYRTYEELYPSLAAAKAAATSPHLKPRVAHGVAGQGFLEHGAQIVAHVPVSESELSDYKRWRKAYEAGKADVGAM